MWGPQNLLFLLCIAPSCVTNAAESIRVSGNEGREVNISCPYEKGYESSHKYLCWNACGNNDVLIKTSEAKKNRYSIYDDKQKRVFTVTISNLQFTDAGKYLCEVDTWWGTRGAEVTLEVVLPDCCNRSTKVQSLEEGSVSLSCPYEADDQHNTKYICRGNQTSTCLQQALITSNDTQKGQFRLDDDKMSRNFTVTITSLTLNDSGSYLCGVHTKNGPDVFSAFELEVKEWCCVSNKLSGIVGRPVTMQCPYPPQHKNNRKFLCKGDHRNNCSDMLTSHSRLTLQDNVSLRTFLVVITELKAEDNGTYWCGSDSEWSVGNYTKIQLSVDAAPVNKVVYILPAALAVLVVILTVVMVYRNKCYKAQGAEVSMNRIIRAEAGEVKYDDHIYENQPVHCKPPPSEQQNNSHLHNMADKEYT